MHKRAKHFGLGREDLIQKSGVRRIFTPHRPVQSVELFFGRQQQVQKLVEQVNTPGQHSLLYGDRGVGKSSLANIAAHLLQGLMNGELYTKRCDSSDTFVTILAKALSASGVDAEVEEETQKTTQRGSAKLKIPVAEGGLGSDREVAEKRSGARARAASPSWVAEHLERHRALLVIDEADAISRQEDRRKLGELIKLLSDADAKFKLLVVGIAETGQELIGGHPSAQRCLKETKLERMTNAELREIVERGAKRLNIGFDASVLRHVVDLSSGYPHFTHLLALKCAEEAIAHERGTVTLFDLEKALESAAEDAEATLRQSYEAAIRSAETHMYRVIAGAAAACTHPEFSATELRENLKIYYGASLTRQALNNYLRRLVRNDATGLMRRVAKGVYKFVDPRMPSYIRVVEKWPFRHAQVFF